MRGLLLLALAFFSSVLPALGDMRRSELDEGLDRLKKELDEVEAIKRELAGGAGEAHAKVAAAQKANQALQAEILDLKRQNSELASADAGRALANAAKAEAANDKLRDELMALKERLGAAIADTATLEATVAVCKAAPEDKARQEISKLAGSISELTRTNANADRTLDAIKRQSAEARDIAEEEIRSLKRKLKEQENRSFDAECKDARSELTDVSSKLATLEMKSNEAAAEASKTIATLENTLAAIQLELANKPVRVQLCEANLILLLFCLTLLYMLAICSRFNFISFVSSDERPNGFLHLTRYLSGCLDNDGRFLSIPNRMKKSTHKRKRLLRACAWWSHMRRIKWWIFRRKVCLSSPPHASSLQNISSGFPYLIYCRAILNSSQGDESRARVSFGTGAEC